MACSGCNQARAQFVSAARTFNARGMVQAMGTAVAINSDKLRGLSQEEINAKYGGRPAPSVTLATPYQRTR